MYKEELLMNQLGVKPDTMPVVPASLERAEETDAPAVAMEMPDGKIVTGKTSSLLGASSALPAQRAQIPGRHTERHHAHRAQHHRTHTASEG